MFVRWTIFVREHLREVLYTHYKDLYENFENPALDEKISFSISCGDGWFRLVQILSSILENFNPSIHAERVASQSGSLIYLISGGSNLGELGAVIAAQFFSSRVSETTGFQAYFRLNQPEADRKRRPHSTKRRADSFDQKGEFPNIANNLAVEVGRFGDFTKRHRSAKEPAGVILRCKYGLCTDCEIDIPEVLFNLADCALAAIERILNPGRINMLGTSHLPIERVIFSKSSGLMVAVRQGATIAAAERELAYKSKVHLVDNIDLSRVIVENRILSEIMLAVKFVEKMSFYIDLGSGSVL